MESLLLENSDRYATQYMWTKSHDMIKSADLIWKWHNFKLINALEDLYQNRMQKFWNKTPKPH